MKSKYISAIKGNKVKGDGKPGRYSDPTTWKSGPDLLTREKYYAFLKHRAQASYRKEQYSLTWEEWQGLWSDDLFNQRGRRITDMCLSRYNFDLPWTIDNCIVCTRQHHFEIKKEGNRND
jgi:hypothetical protein